jgi:cytochrome b pre-mRNA-processing protein 3
MSFLQRIFGEKTERAALMPLYDAVVAAARRPFWYREAQVPDTLDGRFDMLAAMMALVLLRMEELGPEAREPSVILTEIFVEDMDQTLRQIGIGDYVVGKHVGRMMGALGGRLAAFREAGAGDLDGPVRRNLYRGEPPSADALALASGRLAAFRDGLAAFGLADLQAGRLPALS